MDHFNVNGSIFAQLVNKQDREPARRFSLLRPVLALKNNLPERFNVQPYHARPLLELASAINYS